MKIILLVEDDEAIRSALAELLADLDEGYRIIQAENGREAINVLHGTAVDLVITDLNMPVLDGFALLAHLMSAHTRMPIIVLTAYGTPDTRRHLKEMGAGYLEKPLDLPLLPGVVREKLAQQARGHIEGITLSSLLQILNLERKSCALHVESGGRLGELVFEAGQMVHAEIDGAVGLDAAHAILCWEEPRIEIGATPSRPSRTIGMELLHILLESARRRDEEERARARPQTAE
jgi:DNA-binding response OmpR family regulator